MTWLSSSPHPWAPTTACLWPSRARVRTRLTGSARVRITACCAALSCQELRQIMLQHGGRYENYMYRDVVTHIICANLPDTKLKQMAKERLVDDAHMLLRSLH
jgi:hypothetical protein